MGGGKGSSPPAAGASFTGVPLDDLLTLDKSAGSPPTKIVAEIRSYLAAAGYVQCSDPLRKLLSARTQVMAAPSAPAPQSPCGASRVGTSRRLRREARVVLLREAGKRIARTWLLSAHPTSRAAAGSVKRIRSFSTTGAPCPSPQLRLPPTRSASPIAAAKVKSLEQEGRDDLAPAQSPCSPVAAQPDRTSSISMDRMSTVRHLFH